MTQRIKTPRDIGGLDDETLTEADVRRLFVPVHRSTLHRMVRRGDFPRPFRLTSTRIGWRKSDVIAWRDAKVKNEA